MSQEGTQEPEAVRALKDKLAELEDLQLVNKLDIINVKNELDRVSLSGGPSTDDMDRISELKDLLEKSENFKKAEKLAGELGEMKEKIADFRGADAGRLKDEVESLTKELSKVKEKIREVEKSKGATSKGGAVPSPDLKELRDRIGKLESAKPGDIDLEVPDEVREEISRIKERLSGIEKSPGKPSKGKAAEISDLHDITERIDQLNSSLEEQRQRISGLESDIASSSSKKGKPAPAGSAIVGRMDRLEKKLSEMGSAPSAGPAPAVPDKKLKALTSDLRAMKEKVEGLEKKAANVDLSAIEKMKSKEGTYPAGEMGDVRQRIDGLEKDLRKLSKLAMALKPIELPESRGDGKGVKELDDRLKEVERTMGSGVGEERFRTLEKKMDEMREWLPEYIDSNVKKKLEGMGQNVDKKVKDLGNLKDELVNSTLEQMLAQPGTVSKMVGDKLRKQVEELQERIKKMDSMVKPSDAKLTALIKEAEDAVRDIENLKKDVKGIKSVSREELEDIGTELRTLSTRLDSIESSTKAVESTGVTGVMRDLEILKTKADWLESTVHKLDLDKIFERIEELENMMRATSQASSASPIIIE